MWAMRCLCVFGLCVSLAACGGKAPSGTEGEPPVAEPPAALPDAPGSGEPVAGEERTQATDPQALYAECRDRVESPQSEDECTADADCAKSGCSSEVCTTKVAGADLMTTCEHQACFEVLDACACQQGQCRWTLKGAPQAPPE